MDKSSYLSNLKTKLADLLGIKLSKQIVDNKGISNPNASIGREIQNLYRKVDPEMGKAMASSLKVGDNGSIIYVLSEMPSILKSMDKVPSNDIILEVIPRSPQIFLYLKSPSDKLISDALAVNSEVIKYIVNPSQKHLLEAISYNPTSIRFIKNPNEALQIEAVKRNQSAIECIEKPAPDLIKKAGWIVYDPNSKYSFASLPDKINQPFHEGDVYSSVMVELTEDLKKDLLRCGRADLGYDDSPRFDISGGHQLIILNKDGSMGYDQRTTKIEGGSVNYYDLYVPINKEHCSHKPEKLKVSQDVKVSPKLRR
jgi:hypothetical protein